MRSLCHKLFQYSGLSVVVLECCLKFVYLCSEFLPLCLLYRVRTVKESPGWLSTNLKVPGGIHVTTGVEGFGFFNVLLSVFLELNADYRD